MLQGATCTACNAPLDEHAHRAWWLDEHGRARQHLGLRPLHARSRPRPAKDRRAGHALRIGALRAGREHMSWLWHLPLVIGVVVGLVLLIATLRINTKGRKL
jgi:hypothetical protein